MTSTTLFVVMVAVGSVGKSASLRLYYYCRHSIGEHGASYNVAIPVTRYIKRQK